VEGEISWKEPPINLERSEREVLVTGILQESSELNLPAISPEQLSWK
jgi:hypothetical protein